MADVADDANEKSLDWYRKKRENVGEFAGHGSRRTVHDAYRSKPQFGPITPSEQLSSHYVKLSL
jgi:hypothetical protein